eukprot:7259955-Prymnesium_polylepis.2
MGTERRVSLASGRRRGDSSFPFSDRPGDLTSKLLLAGGCHLTCGARLTTKSTSRVAPTLPARPHHLTTKPTSRAAPTSSSTSKPSCACGAHLTTKPTSRAALTLNVKAVPLDITKVQAHLACGAHLTTKLQGRQAHPSWSIWATVYGRHI